MKETEKKGGQVDDAVKLKSTQLRPGSEFVSSAIGMSWQLAIVVLVPVIGGYKLDEHFKTLPLWTIVGFVIAIILTALIIKRQLDDFNTKIGNTDKKK